MSEPIKEAAYLKIVITPDAYTKLDKFKRDLKGADVSDVVVAVQLGNGHTLEQSFTMSEFLERLDLEEADEIIRPCDECGGIGEHVEVSVMELDSDSHQYAPTGTGPCSKSITEPDHEPSEDR